MKDPTKLIEWYKANDGDIKALQSPISYKNGEVIQDLELFISVQIKALEREGNKRYHHLAYARLNELAGHLIKHYNIKAP